MLAVSRESPRKRIILPLHKRGAASFQRMLNGRQPRTPIFARTVMLLIEGKSYRFFLTSYGLE